MNKYYLFDFIHFYFGDFANLGELSEKLAYELALFYDDEETTKFVKLIINNLANLVEINVEFVYNYYETTIKIGDCEIMFNCVDEFKQRFYVI